jgi:hypothetical protein
MHPREHWGIGAGGNTPVMIVLHELRTMRRHGLRRAIAPSVQPGAPCECCAGICGAFWLMQGVQWVGTRGDLWREASCICGKPALGALRAGLCCARDPSRGVRSRLRLHSHACHQPINTFEPSCLSLPHLPLALSRHAPLHTRIHHDRCHCTHLHSLPRRPDRAQQPGHCCPPRRPPGECDKWLVILPLQHLTGVRAGRMRPCP